ncbi:MAG TPA: glycosyltransferase family 4 protein [Thermoanaerobaculia bacterium]|jgi:glycosyltransferase involved in cell wall biosynthesis
MADRLPDLRVAIVAGSLRRGGAEKQLWHLASGLRGAGVQVGVYSLTRGEYYESRLAEEGIPTTWIGRSGFPPARLIALARALRDFRPQIVQASHAFANLYAAAAAKVCGAVSVGALRGSLRRCVESNGAWARPIIRRPTALVANSRRAADEVARSGLRDASLVFVLENAIAIPPNVASVRPAGSPLRAVLLGSLTRVKRADLFLEALAQARRAGAPLSGLVVGDGPERGPLEALARARGLLPDGVRFLGERSDVAEILSQADLLALTSDDEGLPNAVLEGMAAGLPVVATPAGDTPELVQDGRTGWLVPFGDAPALAARLVELCASPEVRASLGRAGRELVAARHGTDRMTGRALEIYREIAERKGRGQLRSLLAA